MMTKEIMIKKKKRELKRILNSKLLQAVKDGCMEDVRSFLQYGASADGVSGAPLRYACEYGHTAIARLLLDAGANARATVENGTPLLHMACAEGRTAIARLLLDAGADINARDRGYRQPLHLACQFGHTDVARLLLDAGAKTFARQKSGGWTALHLACHHGHAGVVRLLIEHYANVMARNWLDETPLHRACSNNHNEVVKLLLDAGADINALDKKGRTPADLIREQTDGNDQEYENSDECYPALGLQCL